MLFHLLACSEYGLEKPAAVGDPAPDEAETHHRRETPPDDTHPDDDTGGAPPDSGPADTRTLPDDCTTGYVGDYYNLPADHPDVEGPVTGLVPGDVPANHDWWDARYFAFERVDTSLEFGDQWWPVDTGLPGDPQYYAVHWVATLDVAQDGPVLFEMGSDDDGWAVLDGALVADLGGIHAVASTAFTVDMTTGLHSLELWMAERHTTDAGFWFRWVSADVGFYACP
jgi:fibro-slime domain-containing protein